MKKLLLTLIYIYFIFASGLAWSDVRDPGSAQGFVGTSANNVMASWGQPDVRLTRNNGRTVLVYRIVTSQTYYDQKSPQVGVSGRAIIVKGPPGSPAEMNPSPVNLKLTCTVQFEVNQSGVVVNAGMSGNGC